MKIAAYNPCSFLDYPGKISAVIFTQGCNMNCPYCHNAGLTAEKVLDEADIFKHLESRKGSIDGVVISGGEPTIHKDLPELLKKVKSLGYPVKLDTNGSNSRLLEEIIRKNLVDYIAMDIKTVPEAYEAISGMTYDSVRDSISILRAFGSCEFRTTVYPSIDIPSLERLCKEYSKDAFYLQQFRVNSVDDPEPYPVSVMASLEQRYGVKVRGC